MDIDITLLASRYSQKDIGAQSLAGNGENTIAVFCILYLKYRVNRYKFQLKDIVPETMKLYIRMERKCKGSASSFLYQGNEFFSSFIYCVGW